MQCIRIMLVIAIVVSGCHDHPHRNETQTEPHLQAYLKLKKKSPDSALIELKTHANLTFDAHPKANEWAELAARLDRAEKASLPDIQRLGEIVIMMAKDNQKDMAHIQELEDNLLLWTELEKELKAEGTDMTTFYIRFRLTPTEKEKPLSSSITTSLTNDQGKVVSKTQ